MAHFNRNRGFDKNVDPRFFTVIKSAISMAMDYGRGNERFHKGKKNVDLRFFSFPRSWLNWLYTKIWYPNFFSSGHTGDIKTKQTKMSNSKN